MTQRAYFFTAPPPTDPSPRDPTTSTLFNHADRIEQHLKDIRQTKWGFVIYRCDYSCESNWSKAISHLQDSINKSLEANKGLDMLDSMLFTVMEDKELLDDASTTTVRAHFNEWLQTAPLLEQGIVKSEDPADFPEEWPWNTGSPRYAYCIQIDPENLESMLDDKTYNYGGFVNLISAAWATERESNARLQALFPGRTSLQWREGRTVEVREAIEGCTEPDVGWMQVGCDSAMVDMYYRLQGGGECWEVEYRRPPTLAHA